ATWPPAGSRPATASRSSRSSRSTARCSRASAARSTSSAGRWPRPCGSRSTHEKANASHWLYRERFAFASRGCPVSDLSIALPAPSELQRLRARGRVRGLLPLLGPAFVASVAYVDPGNFGTNIPAGAPYGYLLLWVILAANLMAMLIQGLSAKVGIATGKNLPALCRERFPRPVSWGLWVQAELIAMATDLAEFVGAAIALRLLFGVSYLVAGVITGVVAFAILALQSRG